MSVYTQVYGPTYGGGGGAGWPYGATIDADVELNLGGTWTDVSQYTLQREGGTPPIIITRGRPDETATANPSSAGFQLNNRDGRFSRGNPLGPYYGQFGRNTPVRISVPDSVTSLRMEDDQVSFSATTSAPAGLAGNTDQDIRMDLQLSGGSPCVLASWWGNSQRSWCLLLNGDGTVAMAQSLNGVNIAVTASSTMPLPPGRIVLRVTYTEATGNLNFYTAPAGGILLGPWTLLGQPNVSTNGPGLLWGSTAVLSVGYNATAVVTDALAGGGMNGRVSDFLVLSGINGTPLARAAFSAQPAGTTTWADGYGNTWSLGGTSAVSGRSFRYHGEMSALPVAWDPSGKDVWEPVTSGGILRRIQAGNTPVPSVIKRYVQQDAAGLQAYWPCEDGTLAAAIASGMPGGLPLILSRGKMVFATDTSFGCSAALPQISTGFAHGGVVNYTDTGTLVIRFLLNVPSGFAGAMTFLRLNTTGTAGPIYFVYDNVGGGLGAFSNGSFAFTGTEVPYTPGTPVLVSLELTTSGGTVTPVFRTMTTAGVVASSAYAGYTGFTGRVLDCAIPPVGDITAWPAAPGLTVIGHIFVQSAYQALTTGRAPLLSNVIQAWNGETAGNRFARLCAENSIQSRIVGPPNTSAAMGPQAQGTLTQLLQECETADMGMIFEPRTCLGLGYRTLASLTDQAAAVVLDYSQAQLGETGQPGELEITDDDQQTRNDIVVARQNTSGSSSQGATYQMTLNDGSAMSISLPPAGVGDYNSQVSANVQSDTQLPDVAGWLLHVGTCPEERYPRIPLNLARPADIPFLFTIMGLDLGDYAQVINPPAWMPPGPVKQLIYGVKESLGGMWYLMDWQAVPESVFEVGLLDDLVFGRADTDGSQLHAAIGTADTVILADLTGPSGTPWTTAQASLPFSIAAGGEEMTVTDVAGPPNNFLTGNGATFDTGLANWVNSTNCTIVQTTAVAHSGPGSLQINAVINGDMGPSSCAAGSIATLGLPCSAGDTIVCSAWWMAALTPRQIQMGAQFFTSGGAAISQLNDSADALNDTTTGWTKVTGTVTAPATSAYCKLFPLVKSCVGGEQHWMDDAYIADLTSGASARQSMTVTRSVNGIVKSQAPGTAIALYQPPVTAVL